MDSTKLSNQNKPMFPWETFNYNQQQLTDRIKWHLKKMDIIDNTGFAICKNGITIRCCLCGAIPIINIKNNTVICSYNALSKSGKPMYEFNQFYNCSSMCGQYSEKIHPEIIKRRESCKKRIEEKEFEKRFQKEKKEEEKEKRYQKYKEKNNEK